MRLPMRESDSVAWKLERVSPRCFFGHGWWSCEAAGTLTGFKNVNGHLRQPSVDDGNDSSAIVGGE